VIFVLLSVQALADDCIPVGTWAIPSAQGAVRASAREVLLSVSKRSVVLLGERHERADHHRWQLQTLAGLLAQRDDLVLGFEMFPRRVQGVLDRWVAGELSETEFLDAVDWARVWGFATEHYLPLFHFARLNRIPMLALNVERSLIRTLVRNGADAVPEAMREGVGPPAAASPAYLRELYSSYLEHPEFAKVTQDDPDFLRFVQGQLTWDRAMAEAIRNALAGHRQRQVVAVMGRGHTGQGAVPHQLRDLGIRDVAVLLPWERTSECDRLTPEIATAVFSVEAPRATAKGPERPPLGVVLASAEGSAVRIDRVVAGSIAESAGLRSGDVLLSVAGGAVKTVSDVQRAIFRQAPGTWLPLRVSRDGGELELVAKFPPE
jgi:uncharacterized iron-regulated protein